MKRANLMALVFTGLILIFTNNAFGQWHKDFPDAYRNNVKAGKFSKTKANEKVTTNAKRTNTDKMQQQPSALITEVSFPALDIKSSKSKRKYIGKWEGPDFDAAKSIKSQIKPTKSSGYIGETEKNLTAKRKSSKTKAKNEDIEVEKDETHRTKY